MTYRDLHWRDEEARLKTYSAAVRAGGGTLVRIEIQVTDERRLGMLIEDLAKIYRDQGKPGKGASRKDVAKPLPAPAPLLLTYGSKP